MNLDELNNLINRINSCYVRKLNLIQLRKHNILIINISMIPNLLLYLYKLS